jgi:hypothetical protein
MNSHHTMKAPAAAAGVEKAEKAADKIAIR